MRGVGFTLRLEYNYQTVCEHWGVSGIFFDLKKEKKKIVQLKQRVVRRRKNLRLFVGFGNSLALETEVGLSRSA